MSLPSSDPPKAHALTVMPGITGGHDGLPHENTPQTNARSTPSRRLPVPVDTLIQGILAGDRVKLAQGITLVESNAAAHFQAAQALLGKLLPHTGQSLRIGITGVPGAGKSTFIDAFGMQRVNAGQRVAVTAVDPSSTLTSGSLLGDKTRMAHLATHPAAFIRPSPSGGALGGVARKTRESLLLFEAAGFDLVMVETVGVGQSEVSVRSMVDFFLLILAPGAGDELQGIKKGVVELADAILINKADGPSQSLAELSRAEYERALHYLQPLTPGWRPPVLAVSAQEGTGLDSLWDTIQTFVTHTKASGFFEERRHHQEKAWMHTLVEDQLKTRFYSHSAVVQHLPALEQAVFAGKMTATQAAMQLLEAFDQVHHG